MSDASSYSLLPPTSNPWLLKGGDLALYNSTLVLAANALFQHATVFGLIFLLRGFSPKRALDLHFLTIVFAVSFVAAPLVFLLDTKIDGVKLWFFLEHEAVEYLIAIRVLAPLSFVKRRAGLIVFLCWVSLSAVSILVSLNAQYEHGADIVAWGAFLSDALISTSGGVLIARWIRNKKREKKPGEISSVPNRFKDRKIAAEALAGIGYCCHGLSTMTIAPILNNVLYHDLDPAYFAYAWVIVFFFAFFTIGLSVPSASIFFSTINWWFWHDRKVLPGEAGWTSQDIEKGVATKVERRRISETNSRSPRTRGPSYAYWTKLGEKYAISPSSSVEESDRRAGWEDVR